MGLNGRLEDLPLLDIVQVVAFSQKTGFLSLETPRGEGAIVFERGLVVSCFTPDTPPIELDAVLGSPDKKVALITRRIETALEHLVRLREGQFHFRLTTEVPATVGTRDIATDTLEHGLKAEGLLLDMARGMDEDRRDAAAAVETGFAESAEAVEPKARTDPEPDPVADIVVERGRGEGPEEPPAEPREPEPLLELEALPEDDGRHRVVLLVEDEPDLRELLAHVFIEGGWQVVEAGTPKAALRAARSLQDIGLPFVLVVDRGMPTSDGSSFDGGFEVVRRLRKAGFEPPALLMTDRLTRATQERARRLGVAKFVFKPSLSRLDPDQFAADIRAFGHAPAGRHPAHAGIRGHGALAHGARPRHRPPPNRGGLARGGRPAAAARGPAPPPGRCPDLRAGDEHGPRLLRAGRPLHREGRRAARARRLRARRRGRHHPRHPRDPDAPERGRRSFRRS